MNISIENQTLLSDATARIQHLQEKDPQLRESRFWPEAIQELSNLPHTIDVLARACELYGPRPALGYRDFEIDIDPKTGLKTRRFVPHFRTLSYAEMWQKVVAVSSGFQHSKTVLTGNFVGIIGFASIDYVIVDLSCIYLGATSVPMQWNLPSEDLRYIIHEAALTCIISSIDQLEITSRLLSSCPSVNSLIVMEYCAQDDHHVKIFNQVKKKLAQENSPVKVNSLQEIEELGRQTAPVPWVRPERGSDPLMTICYTSGSTGTPKGAMFTDSLFAKAIKASWIPNWISGVPHVAVNYAPLNHILGRWGELNSIFRGGVTHFTLKSDMSSLFEDFRLVRPTTLILVPRVSEMIYESFRTEVLRRRSDSSESIKSEMRNTFLGDRLTMITVGSAPTSPEVVNFVRECFRVPVFEGYGLTESGGIMFENHVNRQIVSEYKLIDVPELGYSTSDQPFPRGELVLKSSQNVPGYFKNLEATKQLYDEQGYLRTGDIMEERGLDHLVWIDRKNNVIKLAQGEFVTLWRLESIFESGSPFIHQIYLYGNSQREYLLAVVVPQMDSIRSQLKKSDIKLTELKQFLRMQIDGIADQAKLRAFEIPRDFLIERTPFTQDNGLLTGINKLARRKLKEKYSDRLELLYTELEHRKFESIARLVQAEKHLSVAQKVTKALEATLGISDIHLKQSQSFKNLGGDSLAAVNLSVQVEGLCGVSLPVSLILNPSSDIATIVRKVEQTVTSKRGTQAAVTFESVHGPVHTDGKSMVRASDLQLEKFFESKELQHAAQFSPSNIPQEVKVSFLTGANGFLGRFLCLELLAQAEKTNGKVYCVVRGKNDQDAFERLRTAYTTDPALEKKFMRLSKKYLQVLEGDLIQPQFGFPPEIYEKLTNEADTLVHAGALVNHALPYTQLFDPNVLGTAEVIRLALRSRPKRLNFISTLAVLDQPQAQGKILEGTDIRALVDKRSIQLGYASGYATSKWAGEVLVRNYFDRFQIPVNVFRCDMIMPHSIYRGQINVPDLVTRLLCSVIYTKLAPQSFYQPGKIQPHFDGLPADFIASAITRICSEPSQGYATYHVSNNHWDDGLSLDRIIDWIQSMGYPIERVSDYRQWYVRFAEKLKSLDEQKRRHSSLPILHQWEQPVPASDGFNIDATQFQQKVNDLRPNGDSSIPHLSEPYIHKYVRDLQALGLVNVPGAKDLKHNVA